MKIEIPKEIVPAVLTEGTGEISALMREIDAVELNSASSSATSTQVEPCSSAGSAPNPFIFPSPVVSVRFCEYNTN